MRFAAMLAGRRCNRQQIFNQQRPQGDLYKLSLVELQVQFFNSVLWLGLTFFKYQPSSKPWTLPASLATITIDEPFSKNISDNISTIWA